jgi:hypothetical protein
MVGGRKKDLDHLPVSYDFRDGKLWPSDRPGLGVVVDTEHLKLVAEIAEPMEGAPLNRRPDGSITNW